MPHSCTLAFALLCAMMLGPSPQAQQPAGMPHLERRGKATQLIVDGSPMLMLGGELHNSSSSSVEYMNGVYPRLAAMHLNTVLAPVAWETIEPREGTYDFHVLDGLVAGARSNHLHLVLLWFGAWKNTYSSYVPGWIKHDGERFPRVRTSDGRATERLSPFSSNVRTADAKAFAALTQHVKEQDGDAHTVLMVQVENEVGVIPESRDHAAVAEQAFRAPVPAALTQYLGAHRNTLHPELRTAWENAGAKQQGTWTEIFGDTPLTDDLFMAWHYATYTEAITAAGKRAYPLPMYANAALIRPNYQPGQYNSGGPLPHSMDIWKAGAPSLDFLSPDIYFNEFASWAAEYTRPDNPLFIPESQLGTTGAANALLAFGQDRAIGFSPFGIDDQGNAPLDLVGITNNANAPDTTAIGNVFAQLEHLSPLLITAQQQETVHATTIESEAQRAARLPLGNYIATLTRASGPAGARLGALFLQTGPDEFLVAGVGDVQVTFGSDRPEAGIIGVESIDEQFYRDGKWVDGRRMNGDESGQGQSLRIYADDMQRGRIYRVRLYHYR